MSDGVISKIQLPDGRVYDVEDSTARGIDLVATYTAADFDLALDIDSAADADDEEF